MLKKFFSKKEDKPDQGKDAYEHANLKGKIVIKSKKKNPNPTVPVKSGTPGGGQNPMYAEDIIKSFDNQVSQSRQFDQGISEETSAPLDGEIQELQEDLTALRQASDELRTELAAAHQENVELNQSLESKHAELESLKAQLEEVSDLETSGESVESTEELEALRSELKATQEESSKRKIEFETLNEKLESVKVEADSLQKEIDSGSENKASSDQKLGKELESLSKNLENKDLEIGQLQKQSEELKTELLQENESKEVLHAKLIETEKSNTKRIKEAEKLAANYIKIEEQFNAFKKASKEKGGVQHELEKEIENLKQNLVQWEEQSAVWSKTLDKKEAVLHKTQKELQEVKSKTDSLNAEIKTISKKEKALMDAHEEIKDSASILEEEKKELAQKIKHLEKEKSSVEQEKTELLASMQNIQSGNVDQQSALDLSSKELTKLSKEKEKLEDKWKSTTDQLSENSKKVKQLERLLEKTTGQNKDLEHQLAESEKGQKAAEHGVQKLDDTLSKTTELNLEFEGQIAKLEADLKNLLLEKKVMEEKFKKEEAAIKAHWKSETEQLEKQIESLSGDADSKYDQLQNDLIDLKHKGESDTLAFEKLSKAKSSLEKELKAAEAKFLGLGNTQNSAEVLWKKEEASLNAEIASITEKEKLANTTLSEMEKKKEQVEEDLAKANKSIDDLQNELEESKKELDDAKGDDVAIQALEKEINKITTERDGLAIAISDFEDKIGQYETDASISKENIEKLTDEVDVLKQELYSAIASTPEVSPVQETVAEDETPDIEGEYNIVVRIMPGADEFEVELPAAFTGAEIISELIEAGVLNEEASYELLIERTGDYIGGDETLHNSPVQENEVVIIS